MRMSCSLIVLALATTNVHAQEATPEATPEEEATRPEGRPAEKGTLGLGIIIGEPTGVAAKLYLADDQAVQAAIGGSFVANAWQLHAEYVFHPWILQDRDTFVLPVYLGPGVRFMRYNDGGDNDAAHYAIGIRAVIGLLFDFKNVPLDVFVEAGGVLEYDFTKSGGVGANIGAGIRYYF